MKNAYLIGFQRGFQPDQKTALTVYQAILKRKPDFLEKQVSANLSFEQKQALGQSEGEFLTPEIKVTAEKVEFSPLAQQLLFGDKQQNKADMVIKKAVKKQAALSNENSIEPMSADKTSQKAKESVPTTDNQWQF